VHIISVVAAAAVTTLLGLSSNSYGVTLKNAALIISAAVTVLSTFEPFFNFRSLWVEHEEAKYRLHRLIDRFEYTVESGTLSEADIDAFASDHQGIWDQLSTKWLSLRRATEKPQRSRPDAVP
jgi:hypothetical protein